MRVGKRFCCCHLLLLLHVVHNFRVAADTQSTEGGAAAADTNGKRITSIYSGSLRRMRAIRNDSIEPCDDFFRHACGGYEHFMTTADAATALPPFLSNAADRMHFFYERKADFTTVAGRQLATLYDQCKQRGKQASRWQRMLRTIDFLGAVQVYREWPLLPYQWEVQRLDAGNEAQLNWVQLAAQFAAHGIATVLHIFFAEQTIYIGPPGSGAGGLLCPSWSEVALSLQPMCRHSVQKALIIGHELRTLCGELSGEWPAERPNATQPAADDGADIHVLLDGNIVAYLEGFFGALNISAAQVEAARKIPLDVRRVAEILHVLRQTSPRILFNYVMWRAYEQLRYEDCYQLTAEFETILLSEYWHWHVFQHAISRDVTMALYISQTAHYFRQRHSHLASVADDANGASYGAGRPSVAEQPHRRQYDVERQIRRYAQTALRPQRLQQLYGDDAALPPRAFYGNLLRWRRLQLRNSFYTPLIDAEDVDEPAQLLRDFLHFAIALLKQPLYHHFATTAFERWHAAPWLTSSDALLTMSHCMAFISGETLSEAAAESIYRFASAFRAAHAGYQYWLEMQSFAFAEDYFLEYFQTNAEKVLFYAVAQCYCGRFDALYRMRLNCAFRHMPEFQAAFNCSSEAPMNPVWKCLR